MKEHISKSDNVRAYKVAKHYMSYLEHSELMALINEEIQERLSGRARFVKAYEVVARSWDALGDPVAAQAARDEVALSSKVMEEYESLASRLEKVIIEFQNLENEVYKNDLPVCLGTNGELEEKTKGPKKEKVTPLSNHGMIEFGITINPEFDDRFDAMAFDDWGMGRALELTDSLDMAASEVLSLFNPDDPNDSIFAGLIKSPESPYLDPPPERPIIDKHSRKPHMTR